MENNSLDKINGAIELLEILYFIESSKSLDELAGLTERMHSVNHLLLDSLEQKYIDKSWKTLGRIFERYCQRDVIWSI